MPKLTNDLPVTIGFRCSRADHRKLNALAELSCRSPADVLRMLLRRAVFKGADVVLDEPFSPPVMSEADAAPLEGLTDEGHTVHGQT